QPVERLVAQVLQLLRRDAGLLDGEDRVSAGPALLRRTGEDHDRGGDGGVADGPLLAAEQPTAVGAPGDGLVRQYVTAVPTLGQAPGQLLAVPDGIGEMLTLARAAGDPDRHIAEAGQHHGGGGGGVAAADEAVEVEAVLDVD